MRGLIVHGEAAAAAAVFFMVCFVAVVGTFAVLFSRVPLHPSTLELHDGLSN